MRDTLLGILCLLSGGFSIYIDYKHLWEVADKIHEQRDTDPVLWYFFVMFLIIAATGCFVTVLGLNYLK